MLIGLLIMHSLCALVINPLRQLIKAIMGAVMGNTSACTSCKIAFGQGKHSSKLCVDLCEGPGRKSQSSWATPILCLNIILAYAWVIFFCHPKGMAQAKFTGFAFLGYPQLSTSLREYITDQELYLWYIIKFVLAELSGLLPRCLRWLAGATYLFVLLVIQSAGMGVSMMGPLFLGFHIGVSDHEVGFAVILVIFGLLEPASALAQGWWSARHMPKAHNCCICARKKGWIDYEQYACLYCKLRLVKKEKDIQQQFEQLIDKKTTDRPGLNNLGTMQQPEHTGTLTSTNTQCTINQGASKSRLSQQYTSTLSTASQRMAEPDAWHETDKRVSAGLVLKTPDAEAIDDVHANGSNPADSGGSIGPNKCRKRKSKSNDDHANNNDGDNAQHESKYQRTYLPDAMPVLPPTFTRSSPYSYSSTELLQ
jgi:hypothetical protein